MRTSPNLDTTDQGWPYRAYLVPPRPGSVRRTGARATSYDSRMATTLEAGTAGELRLATAAIRPNLDRSSGLREQVLSYHADCPRDSALALAVNDALRFIDLIPATATLPQVALADDGEINLFWREDGLLIDIGFIGDGMMHYYISDEAQDVDSDASIQFSGRSLPSDIEMAIPRLRAEFRTYSYGRVY